MVIEMIARGGKNRLRTRTRQRFFDYPQIPADFEDGVDVEAAAKTAISPGLPSTTRRSQEVCRVQLGAPRGGQGDKPWPVVGIKGILPLCPISGKIRQAERRFLLCHNEHHAFLRVPMGKKWFNEYAFSKLIEQQISLTTRAIRLRGMINANPFLARPDEPWRCIYVSTRAHHPYFRNGPGIDLQGGI
jgi:hypothetical protein